MMQRRSERGDALSERSQGSLRTIITQAERLNRMIGSLLDVSRVQTGQLTVERAALDLGTLVERVVAEQRPTLSRHTLTLLEPEYPVLVAGDEVRLTQVFANLLSNAVKYSPAGGPVEVRVSAGDGQAHVAVTDMGVGIALEAQSQLFQRFFRVPGHATDQAAGLGIGLYVVKEIVARHGGSITVRSAPDQGSTFAVHLPLLEA
jgi:signal transduction histidine kinase